MGKHEVSSSISLKSKVSLERGRNSMHSSLFLDFKLRKKTYSGILPGGGGAYLGPRDLISSAAFGERFILANDAYREE